MAEARGPRRAEAEGSRLGGGEDVGRVGEDEVDESLD